MGHYFSSVMNINFRDNWHLFEIIFLCKALCRPVHEYLRILVYDFLLVNIIGIRGIKLFSRTDEIFHFFWIKKIQNKWNILPYLFLILLLMEMNIHDHYKNNTPEVTTLVILLLPSLRKFTIQTNLLEKRERVISSELSIVNTKEWTQILEPLPVAIYFKNLWFHFLILCWSTCPTWQWYISNPCIVNAWQFVWRCDIRESRNI